MQLQGFRLHNKWGLGAVSRKKAAEGLGEEPGDDNGAVAKKKITRTTKRPVTQTRKKALADTPEKNPELVAASDATIDGSISFAPIDDSRKTQRRARGKGISHNITWVFCSSKNAFYRSY